MARSIRSGQSAGWAWREEIERRAGELQKVDDPLLAARATDLGDVGNRVLAFLAGVDDTDAELPGHPVVLVADDLTPSDTAAIDPARVVGFCTAAGGPTSHTAIIARALGIPAIVGAGPAALAQPAGAVAVLDGSGGTLWVDLDDADLESAQRVQQDLEDVRAAEHRTRYEPAITTDGHRVEVVANVNRPGEAAAAVEAGAEGVGLMRTEFLFLGRDEPPSEDEQYEAMAAMVGELNGLPLIVRTLDIGGDKNAPYLDVPHRGQLVPRHPRDPPVPGAARAVPGTAAGDLPGVQARPAVGDVPDDRPHRGSRGRHRPCRDRPRRGRRRADRHRHHDRGAIGGRCWRPSWPAGCSSSPSGPTT